MASPTRAISIVVVSTFLNVAACHRSHDERQHVVRAHSPTLSNPAVRRLPASSSASPTTTPRMAFAFCEPRRAGIVMS